VRAFLTGQLRLELNPRRVILAPVGEPCDLLGYVHHPDGRVRVRRRSVRRLWRRLPALERRVASGEIDRAMARASVASWFGLATHADAFRLSKSIFMQRDVENVGKRLLVQGHPRSPFSRTTGVQATPSAGSRPARSEHP
jgi:hypothetical protein